MFIIYSSIVLITLLVISLQFRREKEKRATHVSVGFFMAAAVSLPALYFFAPLWLQNSIIFLTLIGLSIFLLPIRAKKRNPAHIPKARYDERDIMFSRNELIPGSQRYKEYYQRRPEKKALDDKFRSKPGLLSPQATQYHPFSFAAADANFATVESFVPFLSEKNLPKPSPVDAQELTQFVKKWMKQIGAVSVGITELKDYHLYSIKGRREEYGKPIVQNHKFAVAFTVEMDARMINRAPSGETIMESSQQYLRSGTMTAQLTAFFRRLGYSSRPHFDGNYQLIVGLVARDAGLGDYGRMALLMTPELGARVRIGVVTTDAPLVTDSYKPMPAMTDFCIACKKCADNCPSRAISFDGPKKENNFERWTINHEACFTYWNITGTDCGKCIQSCPYSHPNNLMHNSIRKGINNSVLFSRMAIKADDLFYGRKIKPNESSPVL